MTVLTAFTETPPASDITTVQVTPRVYIVQAKNDDADIAVYVGETHAIVIDTGLGPIAPNLRDEVRKISSKPISHVLLTHYHFDHIGGAELFAREAPVIAQENVRKRMMLPSHVGGRNDPPSPASALPTVTFQNQLSLWAGGEEIQLFSIPAHTDGDVAVWFMRENVVDMGDAMLGVDNEGGGDVHGMIEACERVAAMVPPDAKVIVGHVGVISVDDLRSKGKQWKDATQVIESAMKSGKTLQQIKDEKLLSAIFKGNPERVAEMIFTNLKARK